MPDKGPYIVYSMDALTFTLKSVINVTWRSRVDLREYRARIRHEK